MIRALRVTALAGAGAAATYFAGINALFWVWVANSAFGGIRAPADMRVGFESLLFAAIPLALGALTAIRAAHRGTSRVTACTLSSTVTALASLAFIFLAAFAPVI